MSKHDVFISYKSEEFVEASWVRSVLEQNELTCWMAPASIPGGSSYADEIVDAIEGCTVLVLILSQKAQESQWIKKELDIALNRGKIILPFMIEDCQLQKAFNFYLTDLQRYEAFQSKSKAINEMIERIHMLSGRPAPVQPAQQSACDTPEEKKNSRHWIRIAVILVPYILGLLLPVFLLCFHVEFALWMRVVYFLWILAGACWILNEIETNPKVAALCFGTLREEELCQDPDVVFSRIASVFGKKAFISNECPPGFVSYYRMRLLEFGSWDGRQVNYLKIVFKPGLERYDPSVFYLHTLSKGGQAVKMLLRQGFVIRKPPACMAPDTEYLSKGDFHICLYHKKRALRGAVIYHCPESEIPEHFQGEWKDDL